MKNKRFFLAALGVLALAAVAVFGLDLTPAAHPHAFMTASAFGVGLADPQLKAAFDQIGKAFEEFKTSHTEQVKEIKKGLADPVLTERLTKIEKSLDAAVEAKAAIEAKFATEAKEREALEAKLNLAALTGGKPEDAAAELKAFNATMAGIASERKRSFAPIDAEGYAGYKAAYGKYLREGQQALTNEEFKTLSVGSDPDGGYFVTPDTSGRMIKKVFETSEMRQIASVQAISTDRLQGMEDRDEAGAAYAGEHATSGNATTPQVGKWDISVFWIDTEPKVTQQLLDDAEVDIEAWLAAKVADKFARFENNEFLNGAANKIRGFVGGYETAADDGTGVTWGKIGYVATGTSGDFAASNPADKIFDLIGTVKNAYLQNGRFVTRRSVITKIRKFKDGQGNYLWQPSFVMGQPEMIAGYPVSRFEDMPALGANSLSLAFGDFRAGYQIVDRSGIRVIRDNLTAKPYVKLYTAKRTGGGVLDFDAIKLLKFGVS